MFYMTAQHNTWSPRALIYFCFQQWQLWRIQSQLEYQKASPRLLNQGFRLKSICHNSKVIHCVTIRHGKKRKQWMNTSFADYSFTLRIILYHVGTSSRFFLYDILRPLTDLTNIYFSHLNPFNREHN